LREVGHGATLVDAIAAGRGGAAAIAYEAADGIHVAVHSARRLRDRRVATSTGSEINGVTIAADPLGGWVVAERQFPRRGSGVPYRVRTLSLDTAGRLVGEVQDLGLGSFGIDARPIAALTVLPDGRALLVFEREPATQSFERQLVVLTMRPHGGTFTEPVVLAPGHALTDARVTMADGQATISATDATACGDAGCAGQPRALRLAADGTPGELLGPVLANPNRAFAPWAAGAALVFQLKAGVQPFTREAPVRAVSLTGDGALQTLTRDRATEPVALALPDGRVLAVWATRSSFGAALAGPDGRFKKTAAPAGPPPAPYHSNPTNRDARAAGRFVLVTWARGATVRVSRRAF
jgi:hypothetical protein